MTRRLTGVLFWLLVAALAVCHVMVAWQSLVINRFWEDEAFNLTVPVNLLNGYGYASDGALSGSVITPFDARISTGPVVLLPVAAMLGLGADLVIGARIIPLAYWVLLLAGLWILGRRIAGRWAALLAITVPLVFNPTTGVSPIQGPADLLGEIPAAALIVWALVVLPRRAWIAGLLVGLAIQAKFIALLALPAFAVAVWALAPGSGWAKIGATFRRGWLPLVLAGVPTLLYEIAAFARFGFDGYIEHLRQMRDFVVGGGQYFAPTTVTEKLTALLGSWFLPPWLAIAAALITAALIGVGVWLVRARFETSWLLIAATVGALTYIAWWATASHTPLWVRHPAVGVFAFLPILAAFGVWGAQVIWKRRQHVAFRGVVAVACGVLAVASGVGAVSHATNPTRPQTLADQRSAAEPLREWAEANDADWLAAQPWGAAVSPIVLAGVHVGLFDAPAMAEVPRVTGGDCDGETLLEAPYRICAAP